MKKGSLTVLSLFAMACAIVLFAGCSYFKSDKSAPAAPSKDAVSAAQASGQSAEVVEVQEVELEAVPVASDNSTDSAVVVEAVEVDAVGVVPANSPLLKGIPPADEK